MRTDCRRVIRGYAAHVSRGRLVARAESAVATTACSASFAWWRRYGEPPATHDGTDVRFRLEGGEKTVPRRWKRIDA